MSDTRTAVTGKRDRRLRIAILYQLPESWCNVRSVWEALRRDPDFAAEVIVLPFLHQDYRWDRADATGYLDGLGVPWRAWDAIDLDRACLDAVLFTSPYDQTRPPSYQFAELRKRVRFTGYVPYGLEIGGGNVNVGFQYQQPVAVQASAVFVRSHTARAMFRRHCPSGDGHVVVTGHPRMDGLVDLDRFPVDPQLRSQIGARTAVLWNAHFSIDGDLWSTFDFMAMPILQEFLRRPDLALLFRPHPLLWKMLINLGICDAAGIAGVRRELQQMGVIVDERHDHRHVFAASRALISDAGSFLMEYFVTGKPVLYLANPHGLGLNEEGTSVARYYDSASDGAGVARFLDSLSHRPENEAELRRAGIPMFFEGFDGHAGQRVVDHIKTALSR